MDATLSNLNRCDGVTTTKWSDEEASVNPAARTYSDSVFGEIAKGLVKKKVSFVMSTTRYRLSPATPIDYDRADFLWSPMLIGDSEKFRHKDKATLCMPIEA